MNKLIERSEEASDLVIKNTGVPYTGQYYHYDLNRKAYFTGKPSDPDSIKEELVDAPPILDGGNEDQPFVSKNEYDRLAKDSSGYSIRATKEVPTFNGEPSERDRTLGFYIRYFAQHRSNGTIIEIDSSTHRLLKQKSSRYHYPSYFVGQLTWILRGPVANTELNGYVIEGASDVRYAQRPKKIKINELIKLAA